jgi:hypothetical protein
MAERINVQVAAWCHFYWNETNLGAERFYRKLSDRAFSQILLHEIGECMWDSATKTVTSPSAQLETLAIAEFEQQDWVKCLVQAGGTQQNRLTHVDPNAAFPFQDDFSMGTIHGGNATAVNKDTVGVAAASEVVEIQDDDDDVSVLTSRTTGDGGHDNATRNWVASGSSPHNGPTANSTLPPTTRGGSNEPTLASCVGGAAGGPDGK